MSSSERDLHHLLKDSQALENESEDLIQEADHTKRYTTGTELLGIQMTRLCLWMSSLASFGKLFRAFTRQPRPK